MANSEQRVQKTPGSVDGRREHIGADLQTKGIAPVRQARSKATFNALIEAGLKIIEEKDFSMTSINEIAAIAGVSVGAFYERFKNKDVFFSALQEIVATEIESDVRRCIDQPGFEKLNAHEAIGPIAHTWLAGVRAHRGLIRASLRYIPVLVDAWFPLRRLGQRMAGIYVDVLGARVSNAERPDLERDVRIAVQWIHGAVVNSILIDPGPLTLDDEEMEVIIRRTLSLFAGLGEAPRQTAVRKKSLRPR